MVIGVRHTGQVNLLSAQPLYWHRTRRSERVLTELVQSLSWIGVRQHRNMTAKFAEHTLYIRVHVTVSASILRSGKHSANFVQWSTTLKIYIHISTFWLYMRTCEISRDYLEDVTNASELQWSSIYVVAFHENNCYKKATNICSPAPPPGSST